MPMEGTQPEETAEASGLAKLLQIITSRTVCFPRTTIVLAGLLTFAALALTATRLGFRNSRADLLNPHSEYHRRWLAYTKEFGEEEDIVVVVESKTPASVLAAMKDVADRLEGQPDLFCKVMRECDLSRLRGKSLHYLAPEQLAGIGAFLDRAAPVLNGDWNSLNLAQMAGRMTAGIEMMASSRTAPPPDAFKELDTATQMLSAALVSPDGYRFPWADNFGSADQLKQLGCKPLVTDDGRLGFVVSKLAVADKQSFDPHTKGIDALRQIVAQVNAQHPDASIGLTGLPVIENDEMRSSQTSMSWASILSFAGVSCVFLIGFGGWRYPMIGNVALMAGMAWAFGFATIGIGHLNILSSAFGAILIGQGIDFGVYYLTGYLHQRQQSRSSSEALLSTARIVGPGIATGAVSTAIAFFSAGFTEFTGVAELGMIAGGGILLCFLAATVLLPAMIQLFDANRSPDVMPRRAELERMLSWLHRRPAVTVVAMTALTVIAGVGMTRLWFDHNLGNLQPAGLESVRLANLLLERTGQNPYFALSMADSRKDALARKEAFLSLPSVSRVEEIASVVPGIDPRRRPFIEQIHLRLANLPRVVPQFAAASAQELDGTLQRLQTMLSFQPELSQICIRLQAVRETISQLAPAEVSSRLDAYQNRLAADMLERLNLLAAVSDPEPPLWTDITPGLASRFVGLSGKQLLKVYSRADIWDMPAMDRFIHEVRVIDREATGNPMQIYEASRQMKRSYEHAAIYATLIVCFVVYLDFRSLRYTLLALLPLALGMLQMFGIMGLMNVPLNAANMIVLPLILGIGVDNGVHVVHDFRRQWGGNYRITDSTANAVFINSLGNMVGFGSLMIASHKGLQSLGLVLSLGMACVLLSALAMPSLLMLLNRRRTDECAECDSTDQAVRFPSLRSLAELSPAFRRDAA